MSDNNREPKGFSGLIVLFLKHAKARLFWWGDNPWSGQKNFRPFFLRPKDKF